MKFKRVKEQNMCPLILQLKESLKGIVNNPQLNKAYKLPRIPTNY